MSAAGERAPGADVAAGSAPDAPAAPAAPARPARARHLYEIDIVRIITFLCVIGVHVTSYTVASTDIGMYGLLTLLHFTREVFFALTAFVLMLSYEARPLPMRKFWPKRFLLVGVPYVVWSVIYQIVAYVHSPSGGALAWLRDTGVDILTGNAWYHLYFLLVTMQVYLLLPVIVWLVRKTRGRHWMLIGGALIVQAGLMGWYFYFGGSSGWYGEWAKQLVFTYSFFIVAGAVAADHAPALLAWVRTHRGGIAWAVLVGAVATLAVFWFVNVGVKHTSFSNATNAMQPLMILWGVIIGLGFLSFGAWWADRRRPDGRVARFVDLASDRSFGIFLAHPFVIELLLWGGGSGLKLVIPTPWLTLVCYVLVVIGAATITEVARRSPLSLVLTGRR